MAPRTLGPREREVMNVLWGVDTPLSVRAVREQLIGVDLSYTTVMTILDNLHGKGWVNRDRRGRAFDYRPALSRSAFTADVMTAALNDASDRSGALAHFVDSISVDDVDMLRAIVAEAERRQAGSS